MLNGHEEGTYDGGLNEGFRAIGMQGGARVRLSAVASIFKDKMNAKTKGSCVATNKSMIGHYDVNRLKYYGGRLEVGEVCAGYASMYSMPLLFSRP